MNSSNQITNQVLMIRPNHFGFNHQTAESNAFQSTKHNYSPKEIHEKAISEFDRLVIKLKSNGIEVIVMSDDPDVKTPDAIFPNNWISIHANGIIVQYPMQAEIRRLERREEVIEKLSGYFDIQAIFSLTHFENNNQFLEGTGSLVLDRIHKTAYACLSPRTHKKVMEQFSRLLGYQLVAFRSVDRNRKEIYHTNVMMAVGETFVIFASETIPSTVELERLRHSFSKNGKEIIEITLDQMDAFAGNMLQLRDNNGHSLLIMSSQAYNSLNQLQINQIESHTRIVHSPIPTIEMIGGGSVRCMLTEVFLSPKK